MRQAIYEAKGRAREFSELACNIFSGCEHSCLYCWSPQVTRKTKDEFAKPEIRITAHDVLASAKKWAAKGEVRRVLLCITTDPYTMIEQETQLTRKCIMALHQEGMNVTILTKGGLRSTRDFDLLTPKDAYATTLTLTNDSDSLIWEPKASFPSERIEALMQAHERGIETWASFEPVIYPEQTMTLLNTIKDFIGHVKIGTLNYHAHGKTTDWYKFGWDIKEYCDNWRIKYYLKHDLLKEMKVNPADFKQTWICR